MNSGPTNSWHKISYRTLHELAEYYGTPYFLYDADVIAGRIQQVRAIFEGCVEVFYAVKANPNLELLRVLKGVADGLDISSSGELTQAALAGFDMGAISFAGPAKTARELAAAIEHGVGCISIESPRELTECSRIAAHLSMKANITLRVNPQVLNRSFGIKMGGRAIQFGIDEEELLPTLQQVRSEAATLNFRGIHVYAGSQCFEAAGILAVVQNCLDLVERVEANTELYCSIINLGGGFGVSHSEDGKELNIQELASDLVPALHKWQDPSKGRRRFAFELGRYLTADAGVYVTRVVNRKESRGKLFFMVDGGLHHHLAAAGNFGATFRTNFLLRNFSNPTAPRVRCTIAGPSCNPTDLLGIDVELPEPDIGNIIGVLKSGSYGLTASPLLFLGRPSPPELIQHGGEIRLGRRSRTLLDFN